MPRLGDTTDPLVRFWAKVDKSGECWLWTGASGSQKWTAYGTFMPDARRSGLRQTVRAHVFSYELAYGPVSKGLHVHHREGCTSTLCVRPEHLEALTPAQHRAVSQNHNRNIDRCRHGHKLSGTNLHMEGDRRRCRQCQRDRKRERELASA